MDLRELHDYYKVPVMCLLRIKESVDTWEKQAGSNGYFEFIEQYMGAEIKGKEMNFSVLAKIKCCNNFKLLNQLQEHLRQQ